jgi:hypothetical protein
MAIGFVITAEEGDCRQTTVVNAKNMLEALQEFNDRWYKLYNFDKVTIQAVNGMSGYIDQKHSLLLSKG